jgi:hypothetical protein
MNATSLMVLDLEDEQIPPSDIIVYMVSTALDAYEKDEININIKISGYEYFNSSKVNIEFDAYSPSNHQWSLNWTNGVSPKRELLHAIRQPRRNR